MALPNPTTQVTSQLSIQLLDLVLSSNNQVFNRIVPPANFKAVAVQYFGYINLPPGGSTSFIPVGPVTLFAVVYARNVGPNNVLITLNPSGGAPTAIINLDPNAMFLYISPALGSTVISGIAPGYASVQFSSGASTTGTVEALAAG